MSYQRSTKYTAEYNGALKVAILDVLSEANESVSTSYLQGNSIVLATATPQKIARVLNEMIEMGLVLKSKSKSTGRMMYVLRAKMEEQGYDV